MSALFITIIAQASADVWLTVTLAYVGICAFIGLIIGYLLGKYRQIGLGWSIFFCTFFTPIFGFIAVMLSPKYYDPTPKPSGWRIFFAVLLFLSALGQFSSFMMSLKGAPTGGNILHAIGAAGWGIYLIQRNQGMSFHDGQITKVE